MNPTGTTVDGSPDAGAGAGSSRTFDAALAGSATRLELSDGRWITLPVHRWHAAPAGADSWMLEHCDGPTLDLGCGPGRFVAALRSAGVPALGVDHSGRAVHLCRTRGAPAVRRDVFDPLPEEGRWRHVLLADGNIGIGGDPLALLRRAAALLAPRGSVLVETMGTGAEVWCGSARLHGRRPEPAPWFPWATVGLAATPRLARSAGLCTDDVWHHGGRTAVRLVRGARD